MLKIKIFCCLLLCSIFGKEGYTQQEANPLSVGKIHRMNFRETERFELTHPRAQKEKNAPNQVKKKVIINNNVDGLVPAFNGKNSLVELEEKKLAAQKISEFPCVNFRAIDDDGTNNPPDVNGAIGFDYLMTTLNTEVRIQNKQGGIISTVSLVGFWAGIGHSDIFDPKITYDPYARRWIFVCTATRQAAGSAVLIATSDTPDPTGNWSQYSIDADGTNVFWVDYPSLGFNRNWIAVSGYLFNIPGNTGTQRTRMWVFNKAELYAASSNISVPSFDRTDYFHISPAITYTATDNTLWCVSMHNNNSNNSGFVRLFSITGTGLNPVFNLGNIINVGGAWSSNAVDGPQLTSAALINLGDDRILQSTFRNGLLWFGHNVFLPAVNPNTCAAQIVSINTATGTATENIRTNVDANNMTAYPSISVNQNNDIFFGYSTFGTSHYVRATISYRRVGQGFFFYHFKDGEDWFVNFDGQGRNRWGDYSATFIDPEDDVTAWTIQQYARPRVVFTSFWGTWWAKICPGSCTNDFALSAPYNSVMRKYEANNTITSTAQVNAGSFIKYDAGTRITLSPGFRASLGTKFQAYIEGCGGLR